MFNVVRAHSESDPNTYVKAAFLKLNERRLVIERASLSGSVSNEVDLTGISGNQEMVKICAKVNNQEIDLFVKDTHGTKLYLKRIYLSI